MKLSKKSLRFVGGVITAFAVSACADQRSAGQIDYVKEDVDGPHMVMYSASGERSSGFQYSYPVPAAAYEVCQKKLGIKSGVKFDEALSSERSVELRGCVQDSIIIQARVVTLSSDGGHKRIKFVWQNLCQGSAENLEEARKEHASNPRRICYGVRVFKAGA